jgi:hypothetical protein
MVAAVRAALVLAMSSLNVANWAVALLARQSKWNNGFQHCLSHH